MPNRSPPDRYDDLARLRPPTVTDAEKPLRRQVAMAYRTAREAMLSHEDVIDAADAVYFEAHPEAMADRLAASARINEMIASAIRIDPKLPYPLWARQLGDRSDIGVRQIGRSNCEAPLSAPTPVCRDRSASSWSMHPL